MASAQPANLNNRCYTEGSKGLSVTDGSEECMYELDCVADWHRSPGCIVVEGVWPLCVRACVVDEFIRRLEHKNMSDTACRCSS